MKALEHVYLGVQVKEAARREAIVAAVRGSAGCTLRHRLGPRERGGTLMGFANLLLVEYAGPSEGYYALLLRLATIGGVSLIQFMIEPWERPSTLEAMAAAGLAVGPVAPGVRIAFAPVMGAAVWLLENGKECALVESPFETGEALAAPEALRLVSDRGGTCRYLLSTHAHFDHTGSLGLFRATFPGARTVAHASYGEYIDLAAFDRVFDGACLDLDLGGEPLLLVHGPKHSPEDLLIFFRGVCISGDWAWGPHPDCNELVSPAAKVESIDSVSAALAERRYGVHTVFSAHADEARRGVDFQGLLAETRAYWARRQA